MFPLCTPESRDCKKTEPELCMSVSCKGTGQQWTATGAGALGAADLGVAYVLLEEAAINPTREPLSRRTYTGLGKQTPVSRAHQDPGERSSDPNEDQPRLACECPGVFGEAVG